MNANLQVIRAGSLGNASAAMDSSLLPEKKEIKQLITEVVDNEHRQQLIVQSVDSSASSAKTSTWSKVVGRNKKRAGMIDKITPVPSHQFFSGT